MATPTRCQAFISFVNASAVAEKEFVGLADERRTSMLNALAATNEASAAHAASMSATNALARAASSIDKDLRQRPGVTNEAIIFRKVMRSELAASMELTSEASAAADRSSGQLTECRREFAASAAAANQKMTAKADAEYNLKQFRAFHATTTTETSGVHREQENFMSTEDCHIDADEHGDKDMHMASGTRDALGGASNFLAESKQEVIDAGCDFASELNGLVESARTCTENFNKAQVAETTIVKIKIANYESDLKQTNAALVRMGKAHDVSRGQLEDLAQRSIQVIREFLTQCKSHMAPAPDERDRQGTARRASNAIDAAQSRMQETASAVQTVRCISRACPNAVPPDMNPKNLNHVDNQIKQDFADTLRECTNLIEAMVNGDETDVESVVDFDPDFDQGTQILGDITNTITAPPASPVHTMRGYDSSISAPPSSAPSMSAPPSSHCSPPSKFNTDSLFADRHSDNEGGSPHKRLRFE